MNSFLPLMKMFANPMSIDATTAPDNFQLELLDMQSHVERRQAFQSEDLLDFSSQVPERKYPNLIANALKMPPYLGQLTYVKHFTSKWSESRTNIAAN